RRAEHLERARRHIAEVADRRPHHEQGPGACAGPGHGPPARIRPRHPSHPKRLAYHRPVDWPSPSDPEDSGPNPRAPVSIPESGGTRRSVGAPNDAAMAEPTAEAEGAPAD